MTYRPHYETLTEPVAVGSAERPGQYPPENVPVDVGGVELGPGSQVPPWARWVVRA